MSKIPTREQLSKAWDMRVSRGMYERITTIYIPYKILTSSYSRNRPPVGTPRIQMRLHPDCAKAQRKAK